MAIGKKLFQGAKTPAKAAQKPAMPARPTPQPARPPANMQAMAAQLQQNRFGPGQMPIVRPPANMQGQMPQGARSQTQMMDQVRQMQQAQASMAAQRTQQPMGGIAGMPRQVPQYSPGSQVQGPDQNAMRLMEKMRQEQASMTASLSPAERAARMQQVPAQRPMPGGQMPSQTGGAAAMGARAAGASSQAPTSSLRDMLGGNFRATVNAARGAGAAGAAAPAKMAKGGMTKPKAKTKTKPKVAAKPKTVAKRVVAKPNKAIVKRTVTKKRG
jgi:hypothetical protein